MNQRVSTSIMVIGTDQHFCYLMRRYVRQSAHPLLFASPDEQALEMVQREKPGIIIMEAGLIDSKGHPMVKALKMSQDTCGIPIVLCTWRDEDVVFEEGADAYLRMPILYSDFLAALSALDE